VAAVLIAVDVKKTAATGRKPVGSFYQVIGVERSNISTPTTLFNGLARFGNDRAFSFVRFTAFGNFHLFFGRAGIP